jgi:hypothetical protein
MRSIVVRENDDPLYLASFRQRVFLVRCSPWPQTESRTRMELPSRRTVQPTGCFRPAPEWRMVQSLRFPHGARLLRYLHILTIHPAHPCRIPGPEKEIPTHASACARRLSVWHSVSKADLSLMFHPGGHQNRDGAYSGPKCITPGADFIMTGGRRLHPKRHFTALVFRLARTHQPRGKQFAW